MNEIQFEDTDIMNAYQKSENILTDVQNIIETSQRQAYHAVDTIFVSKKLAHWLPYCRGRDGWCCSGWIWNEHY